MIINAGIMVARLGVGYVVVTVTKYQRTATGKDFDSRAKAEREIVLRGIADRHLFGEVEETSRAVYEGLKLLVISKIQLQDNRLGASGVNCASGANLQSRLVAVNKREWNQRGFIFPGIAVVLP